MKNASKNRRERQTKTYNYGIGWYNKSTTHFLRYKEASDTLSCIGEKGEHEYGCFDRIYSVYGI